jgi:hypothetical protein
VPQADSWTATNSRLDHLVVGAGNQRTLALQWRIDDRKALLVLLEGDVGDACLSLLMAILTMMVAAEVGQRRRSRL